MYEKLLDAYVDNCELVEDSDEEDMVDVPSVPQWTPRPGQRMLSSLLGACQNLPSDGCEC